MAGLRAVCVAVMVILAVSAGAVTVRSGYFSGMNLQPLGNAPAALLGVEPAAVFVFAADSVDYAQLAAFDAWYKQPHSFKYPVYAVGAMPPDFITEVLEEVLIQRDIKVPVFLTRNDVLGGDRSRVLLLDRGEAQQLPRLDAAEIESRMDALAEAAGLIPTQKPVTTATTQPQTVASAPTPAAATGDSAYYVNRRYNFTVRFPDGWRWAEAQNGDGAVGTPRSDDTNLDIRVWAARNNESTDGSPGAMTVPEYLNRHFAFLAKENGSRVNVEKRFVVSDNDLEGRDYTYSYEKTGSDRRSRTYRGRIQAFDVNGVFKVANVEAPSAEFNENSRLIEDFILNFRPAGE